MPWRCYIPNGRYTYEQLRIWSVSNRNNYWLFATNLATSIGTKCADVPSSMSESIGDSPSVGPRTFFFLLRVRRGRWGRRMLFLWLGEDWKNICCPVISVLAPPAIGFVILDLVFLRIHDSIGDMLRVKGLTSYTAINPMRRTSRLFKRLRYLLCAACKRGPEKIWFGDWARDDSLFKPRVIIIYQEIASRHPSFLCTRRSIRVFKVT